MQCKVQIFDLALLA